MVPISFSAYYSAGSIFSCLSHSLIVYQIYFPFEWFLTEGNLDVDDVWRR